MTVALVAGLVGTLLCLGLGTQSIHLSLSDILLSLVSSNIAALVSLMITLKAGQFPSPLKEWTAGMPRAWALLVSLYLGIQLALSPSLRGWEPMLYLGFPLLLSTGFAILAFGPIRDRMVRNHQRKLLVEAHEAARPKSGMQNPENDFPCFPTDSAVL